MLASTFKDPLLFVHLRPVSKTLTSLLCCHALSLSCPGSRPFAVVLVGFEMGKEINACVYCFRFYWKLGLYLIQPVSVEHLP